MSETLSWREKYEQHIRSARWKNMKRDFRKLRGNKCERCGSGHNLELHHKTYERLGHELIKDLELLCSGCHSVADQERELANFIKSIERRDTAAINTYASKKYGEDWEDHTDPDVVAEEFEAWRERKDDFPDD